VQSGDDDEIGRVAPSRFPPAATQATPLQLTDYRQISSVLVLVAVLHWNGRLSEGACLANSDIGVFERQLRKRTADLERAQLLFETWKFRQSHAWGVLTRYYFAAVFTSAVPYLLECGHGVRLGYYVLVFRVVGGLVALAAWWRFAREYVRARVPHTAYLKLLGIYQEPLDLHELERKMKLDWQIGRVTSVVVASSSLILAATNTFFVYQVIQVSSCPS